MARVLFEACVDSVESASAAVRGGCHRLEVCDALVEGGITASAGKIRAVCAVAQPTPVHALIRPRAGDFCYSDSDVDIMCEDIQLCRALGVRGVVIGALTPDGDVDVPTMRTLMRAARGMDVTFHRAIDVAREYDVCVQTCVDLGVQYILTSGGAPSALEGADAIARCVARLAGSAVHVIAAGGITPATAPTVLARTGVSQLHGTGACLLRVPFFFLSVVHGEQANEFMRVSLRGEAEACSAHHHPQSHAAQAIATRVHGWRKGTWLWRATCGMICATGRAFHAARECDAPRTVRTMLQHNTEDAEFSVRVADPTAVQFIVSLTLPLPSTSAPESMHADLPAASMSPTA